MVAVRLYVEGGGDGKSLRTACRRGFREFFLKAGLAGSMPRVIASGSRRKAYEDFCIAARQTGDVCALLLVDSEGSVAEGDSPWDHLRKRTEDQWPRPPEVSDEQCHLMVQVMESWFLADRAALSKYFGKGFKESALPAGKNVERIPKAEVLRGLENASRRTETKGRYSKSKHSFELLALIEPALVRDASLHAERLLVVLSNPRDIC